MGALENLGQTKYPDLTGPWWPSDFVNEIVVNDMLYSLVESSSKGTLCNIHGTFFHEELIDRYGLTSPYEMVENNIWTFANRMALIRVLIPI